MDSINTMDLLAFLFAFIIIVGALIGGIWFVVILRKEGIKGPLGERGAQGIQGEWEELRRGIEIFCKRQIKRLEVEKSEIDEINYFYPTGAIAINNLKISVYELFIKN